MKCEVYLTLLEEYLDGELAEVDASQVGAHLITCTGCAAELATLAAEQELFSRYDREIEVPTMLWNTIAERTAPVQVIQPVSSGGLLAWFTSLFATRSVSFAGAVAVLLLAVLIGVVYVVLKKPVKETIVARDQNHQATPKQDPIPKDEQQALVDPVKEEQKVTVKKLSANVKQTERTTPTTIVQSDVISADIGFDLEDEDTAKHIEQTQNLLRSIRNVKVSESDDEVDVSYDKALSRRLLNENIVLRRDAEMKAKFPTKSLLSEVEPLLIDIANLPDRAKADEVRVIQERVQKTEIVAALSEYQGRATHNR